MSPIEDEEQDMCYLRSDNARRVSTSRAFPKPKGRVTFDKTAIEYDPQDEIYYRTILKTIDHGEARLEIMKDAFKFMKEAIVRELIIDFKIPNEDIPKENRLADCYCGKQGYHVTTSGETYCKACAMDFIKGMRKPTQAAPKVGRNDPCPYGSGKKYKHCCLNK